MWRRLGTTQDFCLTFIEELDKQLLKTCKNFNIYNVAFFKKNIKKSTWRYHYFTSVCLKSWYDQQFLRYRVWQTEIGNYGLFLALLQTAQKIKIKKHEKKILEISSFSTCSPTIMIRSCTVPAIRWTTERWTDGETEKVTHRGGCPTWKSIILEWKVKEQKYIGQNLQQF